MDPNIIILNELINVLFFYVLQEIDKKKPSYASTKEFISYKYKF